MNLLYLNMERLMIQIPEKKSKLIKSLLKELGVVIEPHVSALSKKLDGMVGKGQKPFMDKIVEETRAVRAKS
jgi:hypothetical protein